MRIAVTGSIATDHLMVFPGRFTDQLLAGSLDRVSLSFLADRMEVRRGGVGANISYGLGQLGLRPVLVGAAGVDFAEYNTWLRSKGVDTAGVRISDVLHTARFVCTTDAAQNQIGTFYTGAMAEARHIDLVDAARRSAGFSHVLVGADDPEAMSRHTAACRKMGVSFSADPSQQLARIEPDQARRLVDGALNLFTNEYEAALLQELTGWTQAQILERVGTWITTLGPAGVSVRGSGSGSLRVPAVPTGSVADPTGAGDAFRAGYLAGTAWGLPRERAAQLGCGVAATALESVGTQEYKLMSAELLARISLAYGSDAAGELEPHLAGIA